MEDILLITNAEAGSTDEQPVDAAVDVLRRSARVEVAATADAGELAAAIDSLGERDLVIAGGDGSLHTVVAQLRRANLLGEPTIGLIPLGTGNDFARGAHLPLDPAEAAAVVLRGQRRAIDLFLDDEDSIVVNAVHVGVGADAGREAVPWKTALGKVKLGKLGYAIGALIAGFKSKGQHLRVIADETVLADGSRRVLQIGIGNGSNIGGGTQLTPSADPTDGRADVLVSFAVGRKERLMYGVHLKRGTHDERHDVQTAKASTVTVSGDEFWTNADGELSGPHSSRTWRVEPGAFAMVLPAYLDPESRTDGPLPTGS